MKVLSDLQTGIMMEVGGSTTGESAIRIGQTGMMIMEVLEQVLEQG